MTPTRICQRRMEVRRWHQSIVLIRNLLHRLPWFAHKCVDLHTPRSTPLKEVVIEVATMLMLIPGGHRVMERLLDCGDLCSPRQNGVRQLVELQTVRIMAVKEPFPGLILECCISKSHV